MNKQIIFALIIFQLSSLNIVNAQELKKPKDSEKITMLFNEQTLLPIKISYSNKELKKNTNDSTYIDTVLAYHDAEGNWIDLDIAIRARGKFRRENCYFPPVKIKIKKTESEGTLFEKHKKLKLVVPCLNEKEKNDNVIKEYLAYKLYEGISPYHFKTRLVDILLSETKGKKIKEHAIKGFLIEDDKKIAKRHDGKLVDRDINSIAQDNLISVRHAFFQCMIGNIDFSATKRHNAKLLYVDKVIFPIPYDFDMCGLVDASYAVVSQTQNSEIKLESVTERLYRGLKRDMAVIEQVRQEYIQNKVSILDIIDGHKQYFENETTYLKARNFISEFFIMLGNEKTFQAEIVKHMR